MPTYQYECDDCGYVFEFMQSISDKKLTKCPSCGKDTLHRLIGSGAGIIFKGSGFYETDYKNKSSCPAADSCPAAKPKTDSSSGCGCSGSCDH